MKKSLAASVLSFVLAFASSALAAPIVMDGSTTVLPFGQAAAEQFMKSNPKVKFSVSGTGTGNGFKSLADGSAQIANASRFIKDKEIETCIAKKVYPVPFAVALDCIIPVVHPSNSVKSLTKAQLKDIFSTGDAQKHSWHFSFCLFDREEGFATFVLKRCVHQGYCFIFYFIPKFS